MSLARSFLVLTIDYESNYGPMTLNGFGDDNSPNPVTNGLAPIVNTRYLSGKQHTMKVFSTTSGGGTNETQGTIFYNLGEGSLFTFDWILGGDAHKDPNTNSTKISCDNYSLEYEQEDGGYESEVYWEKVTGDSAEASTQFNAKIKIRDL